MFEIRSVIRSHIILFCTLTCVYVVVAAIQSVAAAPLTDEKNPTNTACVACHGHESLDLSPAKLQQCETCHQDRGAQSDLIKVGQLQSVKTGASQLPAEKFAGEGGKKNSSLPKLAITAGMRFPMYTLGSRLGDKPNEMVLIPEGDFIMGTNERLPDEGPQHKVKLAAFYIDIYEVTNLQYKTFNDATKRRSPTHFRNRTFPEGKADHPVTYVSWEDASAYCHWVGKRLPTDQEWEKSARGTDGRMFPWGNEFDVEKANTPLRWQRIGQFGDTTPVGSFADGASVYGVYDMSGNVWEWTASWYKAYPNNKVSSESYGERYKTLKGGSWFDCSFYNCGISAPVFNRAFFAKKVKNDSFGFRCAKDG